MPSPGMSASPRCRRSSATTGSWPTSKVIWSSFGTPFVPVVGVALEDEPLAERPLGELEGAGADRVLAEVGAPLLDRFLGHDEGEVERHDVQEGRVGMAEA